MSYENKGSMTPTVVVSRDPDRSGNFVCNGVNDDVEIQAAIAHAKTLGGARVHIKGGSYSCSNPIYVQTSSGVSDANYPDSEGSCRVIGAGIVESVGTDLGTDIVFDAGVNGFIVDMHTNDSAGRWAGHSIIGNMTIRGSSGSEMGTGLVVRKADHFYAHDLYIDFAGAGPVANCLIQNVQDSSFHRIRIPIDATPVGNAGFHILATDGNGYSAQGPAHLDFLMCKAGVTDGANGQSAWRFETQDTAPAVISDIAMVNCTGIINGTFDTNGRECLDIRTAATATGVRNLLCDACDWEGGDQSDGDAKIRIVSNGKTIRVSLYDNSFPSGDAGIELSANTERIRMYGGETQPPYVNCTSGYIYVVDVDPPATIVDGSQILAGFGWDVFNSGEESITGAVNTTAMINHGLGWATAAWLPRIWITPMQQGSGDCSARRATISSTQFQIDFENQPAGATWYFTWHARLGL